MSNVVMTRVDARLIHGQVAVRWTKVLQAKKIVVVDNKSAADDFLTELLLLAAPQGVTVQVMNEAKALEEWKKDGYGEQNTIIIFQNIDTAKRCYDQGLNYTSINIGQVPKMPDRPYHANNTCHLSEAELDALKGLNGDGVRVYFHPTSEDKLVEFEAAYKKLKA